MTGLSLAEHRQAVRAREIDFSTYNLPLLNETECSEVFESISAAETVVCPNAMTEDYAEGSAVTNDELLIIEGTNRVLLTAEHSTDRIKRFRDGRDASRDGADPGTYGLSSVTSNDTGASLIAALGRQTGDANYDLEHPLKVAMMPFINEAAMSAHLSIHRMFRGRVAQPWDQRAFNIALGIGPKPSDATKDFIDKALVAARDFDLVAGVNQTFTQFGPDRATVKRNKDGSTQTITLAAAMPGTTRSFSQKTAEDAGRPFIAAQIEFSSSLLLQPDNQPGRPSQESQRIGTYLGYLFLCDCIEAANVEL